MRSHPISQLILLLCAFAAAASTPCSIQSGPGIKYDSDTKELICTGATRALTAVQLKSNSKIYASLKCDPIKGWKDGENVVAVASSPLAVDCLKYCSWSGTGISDEIKEKKELIGKYIIGLECADPSHGLFHTLGEMAKGRVYCSAEAGWQSEGWNHPEDPDLSHPGAKISDNTQSQTFECRKAPLCSFNYDEKVQFDSSTKTISCRDQSEFIWTIDNKYTVVLAHTSLKCDEAKGWSNGIETIVLAKHPLNVFCSKPPCSYEPATGIQFDKSTNTLTCSGGSNALGEIVYKRKHYLSFTCPEATWMHGNDEIALAVNPITVSCEDYCTSRGSGTTVKKEDNFIEITCADPKHGLYHDGILVTEGKEFCTPETYNGERREHATGIWRTAGWKSNEPSYKYDGTVLTPDVSSPRWIECKKAPSCSIDLKIVGERQAHFDTSTNTLTCRDPSKVVWTKINSKTRYHSSLTCDEVNGWSDGQEKIAEADIPLHQFFCSEPPCSASPYGRHFDDSTKTLTCNGGTDYLEAIEIMNDELYEFHYKLHKSLTCDKIGGWKDGDTTITGPNNPLETKCVRYCQTGGGGVKVRKDGNYSLVVFCDDRSDGLFFKSEPATSATCRFEGWSIETKKGVEKMPSEYSSDTGLECKYDRSNDKGDIDSPSDTSMGKYTFGVIVLILAIIIV